MKQIEIEKQVYNLPEDTSEVTTLQFFKFLQINEEYEKFCNDENYLPTFEGITEAMVSEIEFFAKMILAITDIPKDVLYSVKPQDIMAIYSLIEFQEKPFKFEGSFIFLGCTKKELQEKKERLNILKKQKGLLKSFISKEVKLLENEIKELENTEWFVTKDLGNDTFEEFIMLEQIRKKVASLSEKAKAGYYEVVPKIIAHLARKKNEKYNGQISESRIELFNDLPLNIANEIASFFLLHLKNFSQFNIKTYSKVSRN